MGKPRRRRESSNSTTASPVRHEQLRSGLVRTQASISFAHSDRDIAQTLDALDDSVGELKGTRPEVFA